jgi:hypothetical protein
MEHGSGAPCDSHVPRLENLECEDGDADQIPQFMSHEPELLAPARDLSVESGLILFAAVLRDRTREARRGIGSASESQPD